MSSFQNPSSKLSKKPKISVRPIWRKKLNNCHSQHVDEFEMPTPIHKPPSPTNEYPKEDSPKAPSHQPSPQCHSPPLIDPYLEVVLEATQDNNQTQPTSSQSSNTTKGLLSQDIDHLYDLSNLLEMHLQNHVMAPLPPLPYPPPMHHTLTLDQVNFHGSYCSDCLYNRNKF
ncbi:hypothetical protein Tco_0265125 [Tanacetum coccineum]